MLILASPEVIYISSTIFTLPLKALLTYHILTVVEDIMKGPLLSTKKGRILWTIIVPIYWALACEFLLIITAKRHLTSACSRHWLGGPSSWCYDWSHRGRVYLPVHLVSFRFLATR
jgi:hypothetical protein